jgi:hypothetical protein
MTATFLLAKLFLNLRNHKEIDAEHKDVWQHSTTPGRIFFNIRRIFQEGKGNTNVEKSSRRWH